MYTAAFSLLAVLASTDKQEATAEQQNVERACSALQKYVHDELLTFLMQSSYPEKSRMETAITRAISETVTLYGNPELLGNACTGIICADDTALSIFEELTASPAAFWQSNQGQNGAGMPLPVRLCHHTGTPYMQLANLAGQTVTLSADGRTELSPEEFHCLIHMDGINPRDIASSLAYFTELKRKHSLYFLVSPEEFEHEGYATFFSHCNAIIIAGEVKNSHCLQVLKDKFHAPIYYISKNGLHDKYVQYFKKYINSTSTGRSIEIVPVQQISHLLNCLDINVERITLRDRLMSEMLAYIEYINGKFAQSYELQKNIKSNTVYTQNCEIENLLTSNLNIWKERTEKYKNAQLQFTTIYNEILKKAKNVEDALRGLQPRETGKEKTALHAGSLRPSSMLRRIILRLLASGEAAQARLYQQKFAELYPDQAFITGLYLQEFENSGWRKNMDESSREKLRNMPDSPEVLRAKIYFRDALQLTPHDCSEIAALLKRHKDADEKYFWAYHLNELYTEGKKKRASRNRIQPDISFGQVVNAYTDAVLAGSEKAIQEFAVYCSTKLHMEELRTVADMGNPAALYTCFLAHSVGRDISIAGRYLKLAAALGYPKALMHLAEVLWKECTGSSLSFNIGDCSFAGINSDILQAAIALYEYLYEKSPENEDINTLKERLAYFYFCKKRWADCGRLLSNPHTAEGKFCLSIMLKYGYGRQKVNDDKAVALIREVEAMSGIIADVAIKVKNIWMEVEMQRLLDEW